METPWMNDYICSKVASKRIAQGYVGIFFWYSETLLNEGSITAYPRTSSKILAWTQRYGHTPGHIPSYIAPQGPQTEAHLAGRGDAHGRTSPLCSSW